MYTDGMHATSLRERAYRHIRSKLLIGDIVSGQRLSEVSLAREIGVSRTPVREAMSQLASESFVERDPTLGVVVRTISRSELLDLLNLRALLEPYAAARAARRITDEQLAQLRRLIERLRELARQLRDGGDAAWDGPAGRDLVLTNMAFHMAILEASGSTWAARIIGDFHVFTTRFRPPSLQSVRNTAQVLAEHWRIFQALRRRDRAAARAAMRLHNVSARRKIMAAYDQLQSQHQPIRITDWTQLLNQMTSKPAAGHSSRQARSARRRRR